jgi:glycosyltransferase involved in cell wall biosynthesis
MPAYNAETTLGASVASALAQTVENIEVIVVDDGSRIPASEVLADVRDPRLRMLRHERNRGVSCARNTALAAARAPLVSQLDADDLWEPTYIESVVPLLENPLVGLAYTNARIVRDSHSGATYLPHRAHIDVWVTEPERHPIDRFPEICEWCPICSPTVTARTEAVRALGGYVEWLPSGSDWYLYLKLAKAGWRFAYLNESLARYRWPTPDRGMSYDLARREFMDLRLWLAFSLRHPGTPGAGSRLVRSVRRIVARRAPGLRRGYVAVRAAVRRTGGSRST